MSDEFTPRERGALKIASRLNLDPNAMDTVHETEYGTLKLGQEVELVRCDDTYTRITPGTKGIVVDVDWDDALDPGKVWVQWDDGSYLAMIPSAGDSIRATQTGT